MNLIDRVRCPWAYNYINQALTSGRVRYYNEWDNNYADIHLTLPPGDPGPDSHAYIHLFSLWLGDTHELADTLVHEAFHGYFNTPPGPETEAAAAAMAANCIASA
jgi:hypothetical protein